MRDRNLLKTNFLVCLVIILGFLITAILTYQGYYADSVKKIEEISDLTSETIYHQTNDALTRPINISLTMANDSLLKEFLIREREEPNDLPHTDTWQEYLKAYREKYQYDSVFLVSAATGSYYNFNGLDRVLNEADPDDAWYYSFLKSDEEFAMNVDEDQAAGAGNAVTLFVNCKIYDGSRVLGVVGVGFHPDSLQELLRSYQEQFGVNACFVDHEGMIQISAEYSGCDMISLFETYHYDEDIQAAVLDWTGGDEALSFWTLAGAKKIHIVDRYLSEIGWYLIVEQDTRGLATSMQKQMAVHLSIIFGIVLITLMLITGMIRRFNRQIIQMERTYEQERRTMFEKATGQLFEDIYKLDITRNRPADEATEAYYESLGAPAGTPFDECLQIVAKKQIKEEYRQGYIDTFSPEHVRKAFEEGKDSLRYDLMISNDGSTYYWMRIIARIMVSELDGALYMLTYRQNIDAEKQRENRMEERARMDEMTGLLHKTATQQAIDGALEQEPEGLHALFLFDIDHFKEANDRFGHAFGDQVIRKFAGIIRSSFRQDDLVGRIGGDEFAAFLKVPGLEWTEGKAAQLKEALSQDCRENDACWHMSASIGVAFAPESGATFQELYRHADEALYNAKRGGRDGYCLYQAKKPAAGKKAGLLVLP